MIVLPLKVARRMHSIYDPGTLPAAYRQVHSGVAQQGSGILVLELFDQEETEAVVEAINQATMRELRIEADDAS